MKKLGINNVNRPFKITNRQMNIYERFMNERKYFHSIFKLCLIDLQSIWCSLISSKLFFAEEVPYLSTLQKSNIFRYASEI